MPYDYTGPWDDPLFPKNLPPFDPLKAGFRWGTNGGPTNLPGSWNPKNTPDPSPLHGDMYPRAYYPNRDFLQSPRFNVSDLDEILNGVSRAGLTNEVNAGAINAAAHKFWQDYINFAVDSMPSKEAMSNVKPTKFKSEKISEAAVKKGVKDLAKETASNAINAIKSNQGRNSYLPAFLNKNIGNRATITRNLGALGSVAQIADQIAAANGAYGNSEWDTDYGASDPLSLRPIYDAMLGTRKMSETIVNPQWVQRNPLAAAVYGAASGGNQYSKAFVDAYIPNFMRGK